MRLVFMGNGAFGIPTLQRLAASPHKIMAVITNPDKPAGRGHKPTPTPIKQAAQALNLPIWEVESLKDPALPERLAALQAHAFVVVAYRILPEAIWKLPPLGAINIHPSLLPDYRGPAPIPWSIICGETYTGITTFRIQAGIDTGEILLQRKYPLPETWDAGQLERFLSEMGATLLLETLEGLALGTLTPQPQPEKPNAPYAPKLTPHNTRIFWNQPAEKVYNFIRGLSPTPRAWTLFQGKRLQILRAEKVSRHTHHPPGTLWQEGNNLLVACQDSPLQLLEVQLEGRKAISGAEFARGFVKNHILAVE